MQKKKNTGPPLPRHGRKERLSCNFGTLAVWLSSQTKLDCLAPSARFSSRADGTGILGLNAHIKERGAGGGGGGGGRKKGKRKEKKEENKTSMRENIKTNKQEKKREQRSRKK